MAAPTSPRTRVTRILVLAELLFAFAFVHVLFRFIKQFTALGRWDAGTGLNFTPGLVMILFTFTLLIVSGRRFSGYGLTLTGWQHGIKLGLFWGLILIAGAALLLLIRVTHGPGPIPPGLWTGSIYGLACLVVVIALARYSNRQLQFLSRVPIATALSVIGLVLCLPVILAWYYNRPLSHTVLTIAWLVIGAGIGEEVFYRGYIQSRLNEAFGRPFRFGAIQFGSGLILSSLLFGFLHTLNSVDYFHGRFTFAWGFGLATLGTGLVFGCLREITGSIIAGIVTHSVLDVLARLPT